MIQTSHGICSGPKIWSIVWINFVSDFKKSSWPLSLRCAADWWLIEQKYTCDFGSFGTTFHVMSASFNITGTSRIYALAETVDRDFEKDHIWRTWPWILLDLMEWRTWQRFFIHKVAETLRERQKDMHFTNIQPWYMYNQG